MKASDILFKAQRTDNGEWVEGTPCFTNQACFIIAIGVMEVTYGGARHFHHSDLFEVNPNTICQYIGRTDKNGKKVFTNDKVKYFTRTRGRTLPYTSIVVFKNNMFTLEENNSKLNDYAILGVANQIEVLGNLYDK